MVGGSDSGRGVVPWFQAKLGTSWDVGSTGSLLVWSLSPGLHCDICDVSDGCSC